MSSLSQTQKTVLDKLLFPNIYFLRFRNNSFALQGCAKGYAAFSMQGFEHYRDILMPEAKDKMIFPIERMTKMTTKSNFTMGKCYPEKNSLACFKAGTP